ncbi:MAG: hypothetical protein A2231_08215, partial [Candidatus Firestonebacteria bacterium RIFOXYA2_FULL_40_8]
MYEGLRVELEGAFVMGKKVLAVLLAVVMLVGCNSNAALKRKSRAFKNSGVIRRTIEIYPDGKPREVGFYKADKQITKVIYDESGAMTTTGAVPNGIVGEFYDEGVLLAEWSFKEGVLDGVSRTYYRSGQIWEERSWKEDKENGLYRVYFGNGKLRVEGICKDEKLDGRQRVYSEMGKL